MRRESMIMFAIVACISGAFMIGAVHAANDLAARGAMIEITVPVQP